MGRTHLFVSLLVVTGCGGGAAAPAAAPVSSKGSLTVVTDGTKHAMSGPILALPRPSTKQVTIYAFDPSSDPMPSCENLMPAVAGMKKGAFVTVEANEFDGKPGTYRAASVGFVAGDQSKGDMTMKSGQPDATSLVVDRWDGKTFAATVKTEGTPANAASGSLEGPICSPE